MDTAISFEEAMTNLSNIVHQLEKGDMKLDEMLAQYMSGLQLVALCQHKLDEAQKVMNLEIEFDGTNFLEKPLVIEGDI